MADAQAAAPREDVLIETQGSEPLAGTLWGEQAAAAMAVVLHPATGVPARYYGAFAAWLAVDCGAAVLTYDYRDFGRSASGPISRSKATMSDWGIHDQEGALRFLARRFPALPLRVVGHSLGAQWLAFHADIARVDRVAAVASGPNYWLDQPPTYMAQVLWFWWLGGPVATRLLGYLPRWMGLGADLPAGVYWQWRRWCLSRDFARADWGRSLPEPQAARARFRLTLIPIADDVMIPPKMVRRLAAFYPAAQTREDMIVPEAKKGQKIGHLRIFSPRSREWWPRIAAAVAD